MTELTVDRKPSLAQRYKYQAYGLAFLLALLAVVSAAIASYEQVFTSTVPVTITADRAGLLLDKGADVTLRGVVVGEVRSVQTKNGRAVIKLALAPSKVKQIPASVSAEVLAPTVFGAKYVNLFTTTSAPMTAATPHIESGTDIEIGPNESIEGDTVFENLITLLQNVEPAKVNVILGALSTALRGRGTQTGQTIVATNQLASSLNKSIDALQVDLQRTSPVISTYADVTPALLEILSNLTTTSNTLVQTQQQFTSGLTGVTQLANTAGGVLNQDTPALAKTLQTALPTAELLQYNAPEISCLLTSTNQVRNAVAPILGGDYPGLHILAGFLPGAEGYQNPTDLPKIDATDGPDCLGVPLATAANGTIVGTAGQPLSPYPHIVFDDGTKTAFAQKSDALSAGINLGLSTLLSSLGVLSK
jgi:phospholipid/cholesterol/gamma-HCH transport system substrate-binding protein